MKTKDSLSITIPAYNEEETLKQVCQEALVAASQLTLHYEILLVNDGSTDKTGQIMDQLRKRHPLKVRVIHHQENLGFSGAMKTCYENALKELIFLSPADGQFNFSELKLFTKAIKDKDLVTAYRVLNPEPFLRKLNSFLFHLLCRVLFGIKLKEFSTCLLYRKKVRDAIKIEAAPFSCLFLPELIYKAIQKGYSFGQVPIHFQKRKGGQAKGARPKMILKTLQELLGFWLKIKTGKIRA